MPKDFLREIHRRSVWQVLGVYLAASFAALQVVQTVVEAAGLPDWLPALAIVLLVIGLPVVLATAFIQDGVGSVRDGQTAEPTPGAEGAEASTGATDPTHAVLGSIFTWRNAVLGGVGAFALWGVVATALLLRGGGAGAPTTPGRPSIAVIPFENLADAENQYFTDGVHEDIITALHKAGGMKVISRTSVMEFADTRNRPSIPEIAEILGVRTILEGSVRRVGNQVRVTAQLIDGANEGHIWADDYTREISDVFALQAEIARTIADTLGAVLTPRAKAELDRVPTANAEAYDLYLRARPLPYPEEAELLTEVVRLDPGFAEAWAALSNARSQLYLEGHDRSDAGLRTSLNAAERALELDPDLPEGHHALGMYWYRCCREYERALLSIDRAANLRPGWPTAVAAQGHVHRRMGQLRLAVERYREAAELSPTGEGELDLGLTLAAVNEFRAAERLLLEVLERYPESRSAWLYLDILDLYEGAGLVRETRLPPPLDAVRRLTRRDTVGVGAALASAEGPVAANLTWSLDPVALARARYLDIRGDRAGVRSAVAEALAVLDSARAVDPEDHRVPLAEVDAFLLIDDLPAATDRLARVEQLTRGDALYRQSFELRRLRVTARTDVDAFLGYLEEYVRRGYYFTLDAIVRTEEVSTILDDPRVADLVARLRAEGY